MSKLVEEKLLHPNFLLPKADIEKINSCLDILADTAKERTVNLIPIIETKKGIENLESIMQSLSYSHKRVIFGFFDYALDGDVFPFWEYNQKELWEVVIYFIKTVESYGGEYIHTAIGQFQIEPLLSVKKMLLATCQNSLGMVSLGQYQTEILLAPVEPQPMQIAEKHLDLESKLNMAQNIIEQFQSYRQRNRDRSFVLTDGGQFISPHEYQAAIKFIERQNLRAN